MLRYLCGFLMICIMFLNMIYVFADVSSESAQSKNIESTGAVRIGGEFTLTNQYGEKFGSENLRGHISLVYFGFCCCPKICVKALNSIAEVTTACKKYGIDVLPVFITVDPKRDSQKDLKSYLATFHQDIVGLRGSEEEIRKVAELFKVYYAKDAQTESEKNYDVNHSALIYILNKEGEYVKHFNYDDKPDLIIEFLRLNFRK